MSQEQEVTTVEAFIKSLRCSKTKLCYEQAFRSIFKDGKMTPDSFLELASKDKKRAEAYVLDWIADAQTRLRGATIRTWLAGLRSLHDFAEIEPGLNWKKLIKAVPKMSKSQDRPVLMEEIRKIFLPGDIRFKFIICLLTSGGFRAGAFDYFKYGDFKIIEVEDTSQGKLHSKKVELGLLTVYHGEPEAYTCLVSSECVQLFRMYCEERQRAGEELKANSPLIRNPVSFRGKEQREITATKCISVSTQIRYAWHKVGLDGEEREFKEVHSFRKNFKTSLESAGAKSLFVERLLGHLTNLDSSYYRPGDHELALEYARFQKVLFIDPSLSLKEEKEALYQEASTKITAQNSRVELLETKVKELTAALDRYEATLKAIQEEREKEKQHENRGV